VQKNLSRSQFLSDTLSIFMALSGHNWAATGANNIQHCINYALSPKTPVNYVYLTNDLITDDRRKIRPRESSRHRSSLPSIHLHPITTSIVPGGKVNFHYIQVLFATASSLDTGPRSAFPISHTLSPPASGNPSSTPPHTHHVRPH
jgi:hypothetical protein